MQFSIRKSGSFDQCRFARVGKKLFPAQCKWLLVSCSYIWGVFGWHSGTYPTHVVSQVEESSVWIKRLDTKVLPSSQPITSGSEMSHAGLPSIYSAAGSHPASQSQPTAQGENVRICLWKALWTCIPWKSLACWSSDTEAGRRKSHSESRTRLAEQQTCKFTSNIFKLEILGDFSAIRAARFFCALSVSGADPQNNYF